MTLELERAHDDVSTRAEEIVELGFEPDELRFIGEALDRPFHHREPPRPLVAECVHSVEIVADVLEHHGAGERPVAAVPVAPFTDVELAAALKGGGIDA